jgi:hypothetical protein
MSGADGRRPWRQVAVGDSPDPHRDRAAMRPPPGRRVRGSPRRGPVGGQAPPRRSDALIAVDQPDAKAAVGRAGPSLVSVGPKPLAWSRPRGWGCQRGHPRGRRSRVSRRDRYRGQRLGSKERWTLGSASSVGTLAVIAVTENPSDKKRVRQTGETGPPVCARPRSAGHPRRCAAADAPVRSCLGRPGRVARPVGGWRVGAGSDRRIARTLTAEWQCRWEGG